MSLTAAESPKWEHKTKPRTGVREYTLEVSSEVFKKLFWLTKGRNAANHDDLDKQTVSGVAETILREYLAQNYSFLNAYWDGHQKLEQDAIDMVAEAQKGQP